MCGWRGKYMGLILHSLLKRRTVRPLRVEVRCFQDMWLCMRVFSFSCRGLGEGDPIENVLFLVEPGELGNKDPTCVLFFFYLQQWRDRLNNSEIRNTFPLLFLYFSTMNNGNWPNLVEEKSLYNQPLYLNKFPEIHFLIARIIRLVVHFIYFIQSREGGISSTDPGQCGNYSYRAPSFQYRMKNQLGKCGSIW